MLPSDGRHLPTPPAHPPGFWQRHAVEFPDPPTPFLAAWILPLHNAALHAVLTDFGVLVQRIELREIEGYVYRRVVPFGLQRMPPALLRPLYRALVRVQPSSRRRLNQALRTQGSGAFREPLNRWRHGLRDELMSRQDALLLAAPADDDDAALDAFAEQALRFGQDTIRARCRVLVVAAISLRSELLDGARDQASRAALRDVRRHLSADDPIEGEPIAAAGSYAGGAGDEAGGADANTLRSLVESSQLALRSPVMRRVAVLLGKRLATRELIDAPDDVFFLTLDEARAALRSGEPAAARGAERRAAWQTARSSHPPDSFGQPAPPQPLAMYPRDAADMTGALIGTLEILWSPDGLPQAAR